MNRNNLLNLMRYWLVGTFARHIYSDDRLCGPDRWAGLDQGAANQFSGLGDHRPAVHRLVLYLQMVYRPEVGV